MTKRRNRRVPITPQRLELMRGIHAGKYPLVKKGSGVCPVCREEFNAPASGHGSRTCCEFICQTEYRAAAIAVAKGYLDEYAVGKPQHRHRTPQQCDPWFVRYDADYQRTADPGWGY